jgi:hypothetical protein
MHRSPRNLLSRRRFPVSSRPTSLGSQVSCRCPIANIVDQRFQNFLGSHWTRYFNSVMETRQFLLEHLATVLTSSRFHHTAKTLRCRVRLRSRIRSGRAWEVILIRPSVQPKWAELLTVLKLSTGWKDGTRLQFLASMIVAVPWVLWMITVPVFRGRRADCLASRWYLGSLERW